VLTPRREKIVRVIVADVSGSVANVAEVRDSVRALVRPGDAIVVFDTAAWTVGSVDSVVNRHGRASSGSGSLSAGLVAALRAGSRVRDGADSVELLVVSPVAALERDRATAVIRALWPGRGRLVRIASAILPDSSAQTPHIVDFLGTGRPALAVARNRIDTIGAVVARGKVVVSQFERRWRFTADSLKGARVIARWVDGDPAVIEYDSASACRTSVLVPLDSTGDMPLRPSVVSFARALSASCEPLRSVSDTALATMLVGANGHLAVAAQFPPATDVDTPLARWLVVIAICLAILEMVMRRAKANAESEQ
jgi:hypothetical protein